MIDPYIQQYGRRLYGLCVKLCADGGDAQDLYQDTWLKAYQHWDRYDPTRDFGAWITRICVNTYRDRLRRRRLNPLYDRFATSEEKDRALEQAAEPDDPAYREVRDAVRSLPEKLRLAVILYYFNGFAVEATAELLRIPPGTVKSRLARARTLLKERLQDEVLF